ncbi:MAG: MmcQ/YjbR family DNA-binding protein [Pseudomonadota bacterium]|nr:MmcQ/YjbR family DNA-binding protein [Pseudomonadota bacterium]MED5537010.1 MmcQ/YjbR family DNA-binding protein [Pseudomonadota bacterium]
MTHEEVRALLLSFPGVEDGVSYGEPSFKVAGKFLTWLRPKLDDSIVVHLDNLDERDLLIEMAPAAFHVTDHYRDYPIILARIAHVDPVWLKAALWKRWRKVAPKRLVKAHDAA